MSTRIVPESARWLITQGKKKKATKEIQRAAKVNRRRVPDELLDKVRNLKDVWMSPESDVNIL